MAEIDPLVLRMIADTEQLRRELQRTTRTVDQQLGRQEARVKQLENQFRRSSGAIGASMKGLAATLAASFTGRELVGLIDSYTRLQNQLRVAGLEGEQLANVQERLRAIGRTYGADLESLASTFSRIAQVQGDLGASTEDIIRLNEIVAASLKVAGTDAQTASGALLQLGQAFGGGVVRAEEFNSVIEGALPLAQAAARGIDGFGGSVAKLRTAIAEGEITSRQFFEGVLRGGVQTIEDAQNATLTLSGAFTALRNELTTYVGSNAAATGATGLLANAIGELADNIDLAAEALSIIALATGARYVAALGAAVIRTAGLSAAAIGLGVSLNGVAATARTAGFALSGAFGGPIGLAIGAVATGIGLLALNSESAADKTQRLNNAVDQAKGTADLYEQRLRDAGIAVDAFGDKADEARVKVFDLGQQMQVTARQALDLIEKLQLADLAKIGNRLNEIQARRAEIAQEGTRARTAAGSREASDSGDIFGRDGRRRRAEEDRLLAEEARELRRQANAIRVGVANGVDVTGDRPTAPAAAPVAPSGTASRSSPAARSGPSAAEVEARFLDEFASVRSRILSADAVRAQTAEERATFERQQLELIEASELRRLAADEDLTETQKAQLFLELGKLANAEREAIAFRERAEIEQRNAELADERGRAQIDALRLQFDLATTEADRRTIALQILEAEQSVLRQRLEAVALSETANDIERERARIALAALNAQAGAQREAVNRQFANPLERFAINAQDSDQRVAEAAVRRIEELNQTITDAMTNALGIKDPFLSQLIKIFLDKNVFGPLAEALANSDLQGNGGGIIAGIGAALGAIFGRSSGGPVTAGRAYRVNEGAPAGRVEAFVPNTDGRIIPLGRMNAVRDGGAGGASGTVKIMIEEAPGFAARVQTEATGVAIKVVRQSAPSIVDAAANETLARASRPRL